jgi:hypothetical protein
LSHISSIATIDGYLPENGEGMKKAFKGADIVVIPAGIPRKSALDESIQRKRMKGRRRTEGLRHGHPSTTVADKTFYTQASQA